MISYWNIVYVQSEIYSVEINTEVTKNIVINIIHFRITYYNLSNNKIC